MNNKKTKKIKHTLITSTPCMGIITNKSQYGIIYTFYSDRFNSIEVGFVENEMVLALRLSNKGVILLDSKKGKKRELTLLINTLNELGIKYSEDLKFKYSNALMKHLSTLGWPIGRSLYKQRKIKKELMCA